MLDFGDVLILFIISFVEREAMLWIEATDVADVADFVLELLLECVGGLFSSCLLAEGIYYFLTMGGFLG